MGPPFPPIFLRTLNARELLSVRAPPVVALDDGEDRAHVDGEGLESLANSLGGGGHEEEGVLVAQDGLAGHLGNVAPRGEELAAVLGRGEGVGE